MGLFDLIHMYNAFVNDYLLTLSKSRRSRGRQRTDSAKALTAEAAPSNDCRSRVKR